MNRGFTLIEIIISLGILGLIASLGLLISIDFLRGRSAHSEQETVVSLLERARSESLNNINQVRHGVHFVASPLRYMEFECNPGVICTDYSDADTSRDVVVESSYSASITNPTLPFDVVFDQLNGDCVTCSSPQSITINDGVRDYFVTVNSEGQIDWQ